jgi:hypothetical protein
MMHHGFLSLVDRLEAAISRAVRNSATSQATLALSEWARRGVTASESVAPLGASTGSQPGI